MPGEAGARSARSRTVPDPDVRLCQEWINASRGRVGFLVSNFLPGATGIEHLPLQERGLAWAATARRRPNGNGRDEPACLNQRPPIGQRVTALQVDQRQLPGMYWLGVPLQAQVTTAVVES
jgi:hypothetical protein